MENTQMNLTKRVDSSFKMTIPDSVERKIRLLCQRIWDLEWSGILFYDIEGTFEDEDLRVICKDIYPMNIGSVGYTEFNVSPEIVNYMTENPQLIGTQQALIHSHDRMAAFFSNTDLNTLYEEGIERNHFVSLIVNNEGNYIAAITRKVKKKKIITESFFYNTFNNAETNGVRTYETEEECVEWFPLTIELENKEDLEELEARISILKAEKLKTAKNLSEYSMPQLYNTKSNSSTPSVSSYYHQGELFEDPYTQVNENNKLGFENFKYFKDKELIDEASLQSRFLQIITGSIIISNENKVDVNKWTNNMVKLYDKRFGSDIDGFNQFKTWADCHIEAILSDLEFYECTLYAEALIDKLSSIQKNKYVDYFIQSLNMYIS